MSIRALALVSLFALPFAVGCSNESYYCDATGCFYCDGLGCREVDPPNRPPCEGNFECPAGSVCTDLGCTGQCMTDDDCPRGTVCTPPCDPTVCIFVYGYCTNPTEPTPTPNPGTCGSNDDCQALRADLICVDGLCEIDPRPCAATPMGCDCSTSGTCDEGFVCTGGECRPDDAVCQFNVDCGPGRVCVDGRCTIGCTGTMDCPEGQECDLDEMVCVDGPPPPTDDCPTVACDAGEVCIDTVCVPGCTIDDDCAETHYCDHGVCRVDDRPRPFCTTDAQCAMGRECVGGVCRTPCATDMTCMQVDTVNFPFCRAEPDFGGEMFCVTRNEATSNCVTSVDCTTGICRDGICR